MSCKHSAGFKKKLIAAAVIMVVITAAAFAVNMLSAEYLVMYDSDTGKRYITEKADDGLMFSVEFVHSVNQTPVKDTYIIENGEICAYSTIYRSFGAGVQTALEGNQKMSYDDDGNMVIAIDNEKTADIMWYLNEVWTSKTSAHNDTEQGQYKTCATRIRL